MLGQSQAKGVKYKYVKHIYMRSRSRVDDGMRAAVLGRQSCRASQLRSGVPSLAARVHLTPSHAEPGGAVQRVVGA